MQDKYSAEKITDFALLAPLVENYEYKKTDYHQDTSSEDSYQRRMNFVPGCAMIRLATSFWSITTTSRIVFRY